MKKMKAVVFEKERVLKIKEVDYPKLDADDVIIKVKACGICGTDLHIYNGDFFSRFPLIPGHEFTGIVEEIGKNVKSVNIGDPVVVDNAFYCGECYYCKINKEHFCENFRSLGVTDNGGFAEYVKANKTKVYKVSGLTFDEAAFTELVACCVHGVRKINVKLGDEVLLFGSGPAGLILVQLLRHGGASKIVVCAPTERKLKLAKKFGVNETILLDKNNYKKHQEKLKEIAPYGFDIVIDATGSIEVLEDAFNYLKCDGTLHTFAVYPPGALVKFSPYKIYRWEYKIIGSFAQIYDFRPAIDILENKVIDVKPIISHKFKLSEFEKALDVMQNDKTRLKIIVEP